jgi:hypothetical protein
MRITGKTRTLTEIDPETQSILLRRLHPRINNFNDIVLFLMRCNMDIKYIGSGEAAKALVYYVTDYITKNNLAVQAGLGALTYAIQSNETKYRSDDKSTATNRNKSLFTKTVNAMMARQEMSHQQVLSHLVGGGDYYTSHTFRLLKVGELDRHICKAIGDPPPRRWFSSDVPATLDEEAVCPVDDDLPNSDTICHDSPKLVETGEDPLHEIPVPRCNDIDTNVNDVEGSQVTIRIAEGSVTEVNDIKDYMFRPREAEFDHLNFWEHTERVTKLSISSEESRLKKLEMTATSQPQRKPRGKAAQPRGRFSSEAHPQYATCLNRIRVVHWIPVLLGDALPRPDRSPEEREDWCRIMLALFKPWRKETDLKNGHSRWSEAFDAHTFSAESLRIISNINVENECKDARDNYEARRKSGNSQSLLGGLESGRSHVDLDTLEVDLLNDIHLDSDVLTDGSSKCNPEYNSIENDVVKSMERAGLFGNGDSSHTPRVDTLTLGVDSLVTEEDKTIIGLQSVLMIKIGKKKRPASGDGVSAVVAGKRRQIDSTSHISLEQLENDVSVQIVLPQSVCHSKPEDEIENII